MTDLQLTMGIDMPSTPLITKALAFAKERLKPWGYNHVCRSLHLGFAIADRLPDLQSRDKELHAIAALLHDLGWDQSGEFVSPDKRFEVDGAEAARTWVRGQIAALPGLATQWSEHRLQLLWDAIALHTSPAIAWYKEAEVKATQLGIFADFAGSEGMGMFGFELKAAEWEAICAEFPRSGFKDGVIDTMCGFCRSKPHTTWDTLMGDFGGEMKVEGYEKEGKRFADLVLHMAEWGSVAEPMLWSAIVVRAYPAGHSSAESRPSSEDFCVVGCMLMRTCRSFHSLHGCPRLGTDARTHSAFRYLSHTLPPSPSMNE
ncbi:hypothetical protein LTR95_001219 [Oleoguttula sp. CCFEE 5521]